MNEMITGFNTDIDHEGRVFHVQTEDKGLDNPVVESLIYCGGEIVTSRSTPYTELARSELFSEDRLLQCMESQHQGLIREIRNGKFDPNGHKPFGYNIVTNRSFDEVVVEFLRQQVSSGAIRIEALDQQRFLAGTTPVLRLNVKNDLDGPVAEARVRVMLLARGREPVDLYSATTDVDGFVEAVFNIPDATGAQPAIVCEAMSSGYRAQFKQPIEG